MTPSARIQAAIELLDAIIASARDGGPAADTLIARYFKERRYAGSRDRRAVRDHVYNAVRRAAERPDSGRAAMIGLAREQPEIAALFDGSPHGPTAIAPDEPGAAPGAVPRWLAPLFAEPVEQQELLGRAPVDVRVNRLKAAPDEVAPLLPEAVPIEGLPDGLRLPEGWPVEQSDAWKQGLIEVQDAGSQLISAACAVEPGMTVIDLCAGAGGKTLALAAALEGEGTLIAADTIRSRLARLAPRAERAGATFVETLLLDQGHEAGALESLKGEADVVLVDAPCSGTGTWRRNPEARWRLTPARLDRLVQEQARILDFAAPLLTVGGSLIYATCALTEREGAGQARAFLERHHGWQSERIAIGQGREHGDGRLLTPGHDATDGFYFARLRRMA